MKNKFGFTLLELIVCTTILIFLITPLTATLFSWYTLWQKEYISNNTREQLYLVLDTIREHLLIGTILASSTPEQLDISLPDSETVSFFQKNNKICMYKNNSFYLTNEDIHIESIFFTYTNYQLLKILITLPQQNPATLYV